MDLALLLPPDDPFDQRGYQMLPDKARGVGHQDAKLFGHTVPWRNAPQRVLVGGWRHTLRYDWATYYLRPPSACVPLLSCSAQRFLPTLVSAACHARGYRSIARQRDQPVAILFAEKAASNHALIGIRQTEMQGISPEFSTSRVLTRSRNLSYLQNCAAACVRA
jgi:hypothetical protein